MGSAAPGAGQSGLRQDQGARMGFFVPGKFSWQDLACSLQFCFSLLSPYLFWVPESMRICY